MKIPRRYIHGLIILYVIVFSISPDGTRFVSTLALVSILLSCNATHIRTAFLKVSPLLALFSISLFMTAFSDGIFFNTLKGAYYITRPLIYLLCGFLIAIELRSPQIILRLFFIAGLFSASQYLVDFFTTPGALTAERTFVRREIGHGDVLISISLAIWTCILWRGKAVVGFSRTVSAVLFVPLFAAIVLSQSRSLLILAILYTPAFTRFVPRQFLAIFLVPVLMICEFIFTTPALGYLVGSNELAGVIDSLPAFINENVSLDRSDLASINEFWRGYETFYSFRYVNDQGLIYQLLGTGLASEAPLPIEIRLGEDLFSSIPIFHSGFSLIFVRSGIVGVGLVIWQIAIFAKDAARLTYLEGNTALIGHLGIGSAIIVCLTTPTVAGLFNYSGTTTLLFAIASGLATIAFSERRKNASRAILASPALGASLKSRAPAQ